MRQTIIQVDAFTDQPFAGNPAAVCVMREAREEEWMQAVAREMNLSETAFLYPQGDGFNLRWFTPTVEVELCGHATLASAHVLWETEQLPYDHQARFQTRSGSLTATKQGDWIELDFPARNVEQVEESSIELARALGVEPQFVGRTKFVYLVEVESEEIVRRMEPDFTALKKLGLRSVIVTGQGRNDSYDFVSRFFAPGVGIDEDPVTGAAHCALGPYWQKRLGKSQFMAFQASARGGVVKVRVGDGRVYLGGQAVTVMRGELM